MKTLPFTLLLALGALSAHGENAPTPATPDPAALPGHSMHGDAFNEGPRQAAVLLEGMGNVHLPITAKDPLAQKFFDQGLGQLHGFYYFEAERSFRQVAAIDPDCAMAYWGMCMANINNQDRAAGFIKEAVKRQDKATRQEQLYIATWEGYYAENKKDEKARREDLISGLEKICFEFPADIEAKALLVFQIWDNKTHGVSWGSRQAADALAQQVLAVNPLHPGAHHYLIHLWNSPNTDQRALPSAARCGQSAPGIAHLWHMSGHTFSALRRYADAAWQQEASARVDHAAIIASRILPDQIHNFAHNNNWLIQDLTYVGRIHDAVDLARNMMELPRIGSKSGESYKQGRERLIETLEDFELWEDLTRLEGSMYLAPCKERVDETDRLRALGVAFFSLKNTARGEAMLQALQDLQAKTRAERIKAADDAEAKAREEKKNEEQTSKAMADALRGFAYPLRTIDAAMADLRMTQALQNGNFDEARAQMELAKDLSAVRRARVHLAMGDKEKAEQFARDAVKADDARTLPLATLTHVLWQNGKKKEALETFEKLRTRSAALDLDMPAFARLSPVAAEAKQPSDWRIAAVTPPDAGNRPDLASLGPFRWHPSPAPAWSLPDSTGREISLASYAGKPVLVVFYLGSGCTHCLEQLNIFGPKTEAFTKAGIQIVAVSTDSADQLHKTFEKAKDEKGFPFPIVADPTEAAFKAYRAYDDFEHMPLHGTFLVDGAGLVRWQDISYQPFQDVDWLLEEAQRLLSIPTVSKSAPNASLPPKAVLSLN